MSGEEGWIISALGWCRVRRVRLFQHWVGAGSGGADNFSIGLVQGEEGQIISALRWSRLRKVR